MGQGRRKRLLICMVGGRLDPAIITALQIQPDIVGCVVSKDREGKDRELLDALAVRGIVAEQAATITVDADSAGQTERAVQALIKEHRDAEPIISLNGAAMPMGVGACAAARFARCPALYLNTERRVLVDLVNEDHVQPVDLWVEILDFLAEHGLTVRPGDDAWIDQPLPGTYTEALKLLMADLPGATGLLAWLADKVYQPGRWSKTWTLGERHLGLLQNLAGLGLLSELWLSEAGGVCSVQAAIADAAHRKFLGGHWLEYYVYQVACDLQQQGVFNSVAHSLHMRSGSAEREIDFIGLHGRIPVIASCKTGATDLWNKGDLDEVLAVSNNLGKNYCTRLYITSQPAPQEGDPRHGALKQFCEQARRAEVVVVTRDQLPGLAAILHKETINPTYPRG